MLLFPTFGYPCYTLTQCGIFFASFLFIQATIILIIKPHKSISNKDNLKQNITIFSTIANGFSNICTAELVNNLNDTHLKRHKLAIKGSNSSHLTHVFDNPLPTR